MITDIKVLKLRFGNPDSTCLFRRGVKLLLRMWLAKCSYELTMRSLGCQKHNRTSLITTRVANNFLQFITFTAWRINTMMWRGIISTNVIYILFMEFISVDHKLQFPLLAFLLFNSNIYLQFWVNKNVIYSGNQQSIISVIEIKNLIENLLGLNCHTYLKLQEPICQTSKNVGSY